MRRVALLLIGLIATGHGWDNDFDQPLVFSCPLGQSIYSIQSENNDKYEDRRWDLDCKPTYGQTSECFWTNYVNDFDKELKFECPPQHVIAGMSSYHNNNYEDRRWRFTCCKTKCIGNCQWSLYVNSFDENFYWTVPADNVLVGVGSYHQDNVEDRRWKYKYCVQTKC